MATSATRRATVVPAIHARGLSGWRRARSASMAMTAATTHTSAWRPSPRSSMPGTARSTNVARGQAANARTAKRSGPRTRLAETLAEHDDGEEVHERLHHDERDRHRVVDALAAGGVGIEFDEGVEVGRLLVEAERLADHAVGRVDAEGVEDRRRDIGEGHEPFALRRRRVQRRARRYAGAPCDRRCERPLGRDRGHPHHQNKRARTGIGRDPSEELVGPGQGPQPGGVGGGAGGHEGVLGGTVGVAGVDDDELGHPGRGRYRRRHGIEVGPDAEGLGAVGLEQRFAPHLAGVDRADAVDGGDGGRAVDDAVAVGLDRVGVADDCRREAGIDERGAEGARLGGHVRTGVLDDRGRRR